MPHLILIRHGQSTWNLENKFTGWVDVPLTDRGRQEAAAAGHALRGISLDVAYTSVLQRAIDTTTIALEAGEFKSIPIIYDKALNERMYGDLQGLDKAETAAKFGDEQVKIWRRSYDVPPPNGESLKDTAARTIPYFTDVILPEIKAGKDVLVSAHGNSLRAIVMFLENLTPAEVLELNIANGVPYVYEMDTDGRIVSKEILTISVD